MKTLSCFVIMPFADAKDDPVKLVRDDKRGLAVLPTGCQATLPGGGPDPDNKPIPLDFNFVYDKIISRSIKDFNEKHAKKIEIKWNRAQDIQQGGAINDQVINKICTADITITDITTLNPNVFLEHGIRLAIKDSLNLMICHRGLKIPFDVSAERCIFYSKDVEDADKAREDLMGYIESFINPPEDDFTVITNMFKRAVDNYTNREINRKLMDKYKVAPRLAIEFASFLLSGEKEPLLEDETFDFLESVGAVLEEDKRGQRRALEHYEQMSRIKNLDAVRLKRVYYRITIVCNNDPALKEKGEEYSKKHKELQEKVNG